MNSPFPGMDPYLEQHWRDVHHALLTYARDAVQANLPDDLLARMEERVYVESDEAFRRAIYPDVRVVEHGVRGSVAQAATGLTDVAEAIVLQLEEEPATEGFIEIVEVGAGHRVVTVIEVLSLSNKLRGEGQDLYRRKQQELKRGKVGLVEIDLLRAGERVLSVPAWKIPRAFQSAYQVCVRRGWRTHEVELYRVPLRQRLPTVRVPLRETDDDVPLDLQALIEMCYRNGRYHTLDYAIPPDPPLDASDDAWANELLVAKGLRKHPG